MFVIREKLYAYMLNVQPFLLPQRLLHRDYSNTYNRSKRGWDSFKMMLWLTCGVTDTVRFLWFKNLGSSFSIVTIVRAGWSWCQCLIPDRRKEFLYSSRLGWFRDPHILVPNGYWRLCPWKESRRGLEVNYSPLSCAEVKSACRDTATPPYCFVTWHCISTGINVPLFQ